MLGFEDGDGEAAEAAGSFGGAESPGGFEGIADGGDLAGLGGGEEGAQDSGEEVGVLMRVDVGDAEAGGLEAADLGGGFGFDFGGADAEGEEVANEGGQSWTEGLTVGAEGRDFAWWKRGGSVDEEDVAADFKLGVGLGGGDGVVEEGPSSHEGGGGERAGAVEFGDGTVDAWG